MSIRTVISQTVFVACVLFGIGIEQADTWVQGGSQPFLDGEAPVVLHRFCQLSSGAGSRWCGRDSDQTWVDMIQTATSEWNNAGANFVFRTRAGRASADPCRIRDAVVVIFASHDNLCPEDRHFSIQFEYGGFTVKTQRGNWARIYIFHGPGLVDYVVYSLLLHELGHVVGLDHPDEYGQNVDAVMNSRIIHDSLQPDDIAGIQALYGERQRTTGYLENPGDGSPVSGIGLISGWVCDAERVWVTVADEFPDGRGGTYFDGILYEVAAYGTTREDTKEICGDTNNGFGLLINWNLISAGSLIPDSEKYTVIVDVDGKELGRAAITVTRLGTEFLRGASQKKYVLEDFPEEGSSVTVEWQQSLQNFVITEFSGDDE